MSHLLNYSHSWHPRVKSGVSVPRRVTQTCRALPQVSHRRSVAGGCAVCCGRGWGDGALAQIRDVFWGKTLPGSRQGTWSILHLPADVGSQSKWSKKVLGIRDWIGFVSSSVLGAGGVCSRIQRTWRQPSAARATAGKGKATSRSTASVLSNVLTKEFSAFPNSCFPGCQPWDEPFISREPDLLSIGISLFVPISAWPACLLMFTFRRGWESLAPFELAMNKNNLASQAGDDFEGNPGIFQAIKWMGCYWVFCPMDA